MTKQNEANELAMRVREILLEYGDMSAEAYDRLDVPNKPGRMRLMKHIGGWRDVKKMAMEDQTAGLCTEYLKKQNERLLSQLDRQRNVNHIIIENCLAAISKCSFRQAKIPPPEKSTVHPQRFHAMKSDDHVGELVDPAWVQGVAVYNMDVFRQRLELWAQKVAMFREQDKAALGLNVLELHMLGDHITGETIYRGQAWNIDAPLIDQLLVCVNEYTNTLLYLAGIFPEIEIFTVIGNHGRHGKKGEGHPRTNFDYLFYKMLQKALERQENVRMFVSESPTMLVQFDQYNFALNHNDDTRGWNGIPYYGLDRKARRLPKLYNMPIHLFLGGHFHSPANLNDETLLNGTMVGGSDLSVNKMRVASRASQKIFYQDRDNGLHRVSNIYLSEPPNLTADKHGIYTAHT